MAVALSTRSRTTLGVALGAGVLAGAGQLGVGYGLGIVRWDRDFTADTWHTQLAWVAFLAAVAVICGAVAGRWRAAGGATGIGQRAAIVAAAALGSAVVLPLVIRPAGASHLAESGDPRLTAAATAGVGLAIGLLAAVAVLVVPVVSANIVSCVVWAWLAAVLSAVVTLGRGAPWGTARLGLLPGTRVWVPVVLLGVPVVIAATVTAVARLGGNDPRVTGASGAAGPVLIAAAYLIAGPGKGVAAQAYQYALASVLASGAVSVLLTVLRRPTGTVGAPRGTAVDPSGSPAPAPPPAPDYGWPADPAPAPWASTYTTAAHEPPVVPGPGATAPAPAVPKQAEPKRAVPKQAEPKRAVPKRAEPKRAVPKRAAPKRARTIEPEPEPSREPEPDVTAPVRAAQQATPAEPAPASAHQPRRKGFPGLRRGRGDAADTEPASGATPAPSIPRPRSEEPHGVPEEPGGRPGRRSRRRAEAGGPAPESEYVDWVKGLSGSDDGVRVGGTARHARPTDRSTGD